MAARAWGYTAICTVPRYDTTTDTFIDRPCCAAREHQHLAVQAMCAAVRRYEFRTSRYAVGNPNALSTSGSATLASVATAAASRASVAVDSSRAMLRVCVFTDVWFCGMIGRDSADAPGRRQGLPALAT